LLQGEKKKKLVIQSSDPQGTNNRVGSRQCQKWGSVRGRCLDTQRARKTNVPRGRKTKKKKMPSPGPRGNN